MAAGFEYYDELGRLVAGVDTNVFKIVGIISISTGSNPSGSVTNSDLGYGDPDWWFVPTSGAFGALPSIDISGSTITWSNPDGTTWAGNIYYGFW